MKIDILSAKFKVTKTIEARCGGVDFLKHFDFTYKDIELTARAFWMYNSDTKEVTSLSHISIFRDNVYYEHELAADFQSYFESFFKEINQLKLGSEFRLFDFYQQE